MRTVAVAGNVVADFVVPGIEHLPKFGTLQRVSRPIAPAVGGNGAITAVWLASLGLKCELAGRVGDDLIGRWLRTGLRRAGVGVAGLRTGKNGTATTVVLSTAGGERAFLHHPGAGDGLRPEDIGDALLRRSSWLHLASYFLMPGLLGDGAAALMARARACGITTSVDLAWDPSGKWLLGSKTLLGSVDNLFCNYDEARGVTGAGTVEECAEALASQGPGLVAVKLGEKGSFVLSGGRRFYAPGFAVDAVETTGAGDAYCAGFIVGLLHRWDTARCALFANAVGALSTTRVGGAGAACGLKDVLDFLRKARREKGSRY